MPKREKIVEIAKKYLGFPSQAYNRELTSGYDSKSFTCSGFVHHVLSEAGFDIPETIKHAREFFDYFGVAIHPSKKKPGDLVFFTRHGVYPNHIGIVISDDEYISSPGLRKGEVRIQKINGSYKCTISTNDPTILYPENPIGFKRVALPNSGRFQDVLE